MSDSLQKSLYEKYVEPNEKGFIEKLLEYRREVDGRFHEQMREAFLEKPEDVPDRFFRHIQQYPNGYCGEVRSAVLALLESDRNISYLQDFLQNGGLLQKRYIAVYHPSGKRGLSNVIQIGDRIIDTTYEEFSQTNIPVNISHFGEVYHPLSLARYKELAEIYNHLKIYSTLPVLGKISLFVPFISIDVLGRLDFVPCGYDIRSHFETRGIEAYSILKENNFQAEIPPEVSQRLSQMIHVLRDKELRYALAHALHSLIGLSTLLSEDEDITAIQNDSIDTALNVLEETIGKKNTDLSRVLQKIVRLSNKDFQDTVVYFALGLRFVFECYNLELGKTVTDSKNKTSEHL